MGRRRRDSGPSGFAVVDKPAGLTSHDVVARARRLLDTGRIGHSGTLDPGATGVLLLGVGRATRLLRFTADLVKEYEGEIVLGVETDTLDDAGEVTARHDMASVTDEQVRAAAAALTGEIQQVPPMVSAVKVGGRRLHQLAREGVEVERDPRQVTVHRFTVEPDPSDPLVWRARVACSSGTYVRVLAADLGHALGGGAHLRRLRRTAIGAFDVEQASPLDAIELRPPRDAVSHLESTTIDGDLAIDVRHGKVIPAERLGVEGSGPWAVLDADGSLLAVYEAHDRGAKPAVVLVTN